MEPDTKFTIAVNSQKDLDDLKKLISSLKVENPERFKFVKPNQSGLTVWARDMMVCGYDPKTGKSVVMQPNPLHNWHGTDGQVPKYMMDVNKHIILQPQPKVITDGGDTVANTKDTFVGFYSIAATAKKVRELAAKDPEIEKQIVKYYTNRYSKEIVEPSNGEVFPFKLEPENYPQGVYVNDYKLTNNPDYQPVALRENQVTKGQMYVDVAKDIFEKAFGKPVIIMGQDDPSTPEVEEPASDHLDMSTTPVDDKTFFLGDPTLAKRVFSEMSPERLDEVQRQLSESCGEEVDIRKMLADSDPRNHNRVADFDNYVKTLKDKGYEVKRIPHLEPSHGSPYLSYDNCLMERYEKDGKEYRRVFLPVYGIKELDDLAVQAYKNEGFEVFPMKLDALSTRWGALRCISNWLERTPQG
jgi:hypothetical protein